jgi:hypothetical protein
MASGRGDFSRYNTPSLCAAAVRNARKRAERTIEVQNAQLQDSLNAEDEAMGASGSQRDRVLGDPRTVAQLATVARTCAAHLRVDSASAAELPDYFVLSLVAQDDALTQQVIQRWTSTPKRKERGRIWPQIVEGYLAANPARVATAQAVIAQLDTSHSVGLDARLQARQRLLEYAMDHFDLALARHEAEEIITVGTAPTGMRTGRVANAVASSFMVLMRMAMMNQPGELTALGQKAKKALAEFVPDPNYWPFDAAAISADSLVTILSGKSSKQRTAVGAAVDSLTPAFTFGGPDSVSGTSHRATLTVFQNALFSKFTLASHYARVFAQLKRWHQQYGAQLGIRIVTTTNGYWAYGQPSSGPVPADSEAQRVRTLFQDYFTLPFDVSVVATTLHKRVDGLRVADPLPFTQKYLGVEYRPEGAILTDAQGRLRYAGALNSDLRIAITSVVALPDR